MESLLDADFTSVFEFDQDKTNQFIANSPSNGELVNDWLNQPELTGDHNYDESSVVSATSPTCTFSLSREESLFFDDADPKIWHLPQQGSPGSDVAVQSPATPLSEELESQDMLQYIMKVGNLEEPIKQNGSPVANSPKSEIEKLCTTTTCNFGNVVPEPEVGTCILQRRKSLESATVGSNSDDMIKPATCIPSSTTSTRGRKRKASPDLAAEEEGPVAAKNAKNAIAARENRLKKKKYVEGLEDKITSLKVENEGLLIKNKEHKQSITDLTEELEYYKSVLYNQSSLSALLKSMNPEPKLRLSSSVGVTSSYAAGQKDAKFRQMSGGICLHVNGQNASLEFCAKCSRFASNS